MPVTALDPRIALIVIDLQKGVAGQALAHPVANIVANAKHLTTAFRQHDLPVILVNVDGAPATRTERSFSGTRPADWAELIPEMTPQPGDLRITKHTWGAFTDTGLRELLIERGITQIVLAGISTSIGVESTARQAHELGLNVTLALDAMTDSNAEAHANSIARIFPRLGETGSTQDIIDRLNTRQP